MENPNSTKDTLSELKDLLKLSKEWFDNYNKTMNDKLNDLGFTPDIKDASLFFEYEKLKSNEYDVSDIREFLINNASDKFKEKYANMDEEDIRNTIGEIKEISLSSAAYEKDLADITQEIKSSINKYNETTKSKSITDKLKKIEEMKNMLSEKENNMTDDDIKGINKKIKDLEYIVNMHIITDRYEDDSYKDKEVRSVIDSFINNRAGTYVVDRFKSKITKFGFSDNVIKYFLNIEENFLNEKYAPFNNLFLFIYMRTVGYASQYDKISDMSIKSITSNLTNLIYNKFADDDRDIFIDQISKVLDNFMPYVNEFKEKNTTWKNHPERIKLEQHSKDLSVEYYKNKLKSFNIDENLYKDINTLDGIKNFYNEHIDSKKEAELSSFNESKVLEKSREYLVSLIREDFIKDNPDTEVPSEIDDLLEKPISEAVLYVDKNFSDELKNDILDKYGKFIEDARDVSNMENSNITMLKKYKEDIDKKEGMDNEGSKTE